MRILHRSSGVPSSRGPGIHRQSGLAAGFTVVEVMIALAVALITIGLAMPAFSRMIAQNNLATAANSFVSAFGLARQSAIQFTAPVTLCAGDSSGCQDAQNWDWSQGWLVFLDRNKDGALDAGERVLHAGIASHQDVLVQGNGPFQKPVIFTALGFAEQPGGAFAAGTLRVCVRAGIHNNARNLVLAKSGRLRVEEVDFGGTCPTP